MGAVAAWRGAEVANQRRSTRGLVWVSRSFVPTNSFNGHLDGGAGGGGGGRPAALHLKPHGGAQHGNHLMQPRDERFSMASSTSRPQAVLLLILLKRSRGELQGTWGDQLSVFTQWHFEEKEDEEEKDSRSMIVQGIAAAT